MNDPHSLISSPATNASCSHNNKCLIEVSGEGTVSAAPDKTIIVLGATTENISLAAAQKENAAIITNVVNAMMKLGIPKENIQTITYNIDTQYNYEDGKQTFRGYKVTHLLQISIPSVNQTGLILDTAVQNGANSVTSIQFMVGQPDAYYNQALTLAIRNGQQKAMTIAKSFGVTLDRTPNQVQEVARGHEPSPYPISLMAKSEATPIQPGELKISAAVRIVYSFS
ncbi:SIMPL domain-containing protein [Paenibacillus eucommiae]|uniref:Uncharacterized protein YggE n=1 Tax=Paenibacillus eucommiae TaxID=1355755 RepID=A0ABS4IQR0_9BACL|nr:SIMPL domain-containing protein [Paenibacillus eucommiae]MBP1989914.1 uncharacterized protein YggE [Paenibacillus eucommiae]